MSEYYTARRKTRLYEPLSKEPFKLSRSKIDLFWECPRCFYLDRRLGVGRPSIPAFTLNSAVDKLLKKEFDINRTQKTPHPLMTAYEIDAIPLAHEKIDECRDAILELSRHSIPDMSPGRRSRPKTINNLRDLTQVIDSIYRVRCNLFHGGKDINEIGDIALISASGKALYYILEKFLIQEKYL